MKRPQRKSTLFFERMESRCLLSAGMPVLTTATYDKLVKEVKAAVTTRLQARDVPYSSAAWNISRKACRTAKRISYPSGRWLRTQFR